jgi:hypothetical protein
MYLSSALFVPFLYHSWYQIHLSVNNSVLKFVFFVQILYTFGAETYSCLYRWLQLHPPHPWRTDPSFGEPELRPPPPLRTQQDTAEDGLAADDSTFGWDNERHPRKQSGVNGSSPLLCLPMFDLHRDVMLDMMHVLENYCNRMLIPLLKGERYPKSYSHALGPAPKKGTRAYADWKIENDRIQKAHRKCALFVLNTHDTKEVDLRLRALSFSKGFIPHGMVPFKTLAGDKKAKVADWYVPFVLTLY